MSLNPIGLPICSPARPGLESSPYVIRLGAPHGCCCAETKTQTFHATVHVTRVEEWCVEAETAEEARELLAAGDGYRCQIGDCVNIEVERVED